MTIPTAEQLNAMYAEARKRAFTELDSDLDIDISEQELQTRIRDHLRDVLRESNFTPDQIIAATDALTEQ
jgi:hypothetical protein